MKEFRELGENLIRSYVKIQELYPSSQEISFELTTGMCFYSKHGQMCGAVQGDLFQVDNKQALDSLAIDLQAIAKND